MKRRLLHLAIALCCIVTQAWAVTATQPASGDGKALNPYLISNAEEMLWFAQHVNAGTSNASTCARLTADINLSTVCSATLGSWTPIASTTGYNAFDPALTYSGTFDGNNKTISGLYINSESSGHQALFCAIGHTATIKNLTVVADVNGDYYCAAIVAHCYGEISGCTARGTIVSKGFSGGIASQNENTIVSCTNEASVSSSGYNAIGGIVGDNKKTINCCVNNGTITNTGTDGRDVGGIAGLNEDNGNISNSYNTAAVTGKGYVGGVVGTLSKGSVTNCYNTADVTSTGLTNNEASTAGAIVGYQASTGATITNCHYLSTITLKKDNAATTLVGVGSGKSETNTYSRSADVFKSGIVARLLNGGDGSTEKQLSTWGQTLGTDNYPVFMTANNSNAVYAVSIKGVNKYGNTGTIISIPAATLSFVDEKIYSGDYKDAAGNVVTGSCTITGADVTLSQTLTDMASHKTDGYYEISTPEQMKWFEYYVNAGTDHASTCARLTADIDLSTVCSATLGNWTPIASAAGYSKDTGYSGTFDGNNKTISGLYINSASSSNQALFCYVGAAATIKNLTVVADVNGYYYCAAIATTNYGLISGCTAQGTIVSDKLSGGIAYQNGGTIEYCTNEASVSGSYSYKIGGIVGYNRNTINCCVNKGTISGSDYGTDVGGIAGYCDYNENDDSSYGNISNSYNLAAVTGSGNVGGVVGTLRQSSVTNCYNTADVTSTGLKNYKASTAGAIVGGVEADKYFTIKNCHYLSTITLKKNDAATTLVGVGSGSSEANTFSHSADEFKSGIVAHWLDNGYNNGNPNPWGQKLGTDNYPVFKTADNSNAVCFARLYNGSSKGTDAYINPDGQTLGGKLTDNQMAVLWNGGISTSILGANVITAEKTASRISITDGKDFYIPADVTADAASYTRSAFRDGYHETICLPFAPATLPADYNFSAYTRKENSTAYFSTVTALNAGQAYMMKYTGTTSDEKADVTFVNNGGNVTVLASPVSSDFIGSYLTLSTPAATNYILGVYDNAEEFRPASETYHLKPFRAYLDIPANAKQMNISFDDETTGITNATVTYEDGAYYTLQGIRITSPQRNHIYIHNGKKVIY